MKLPVSACISTGKLLLIKEQKENGKPEDFKN